MHLKFLFFFDINKTILVKDASSGKGTSQSLNSILSECVWGSFDEKKPLEERNEHHWTAISDNPSPIPPASSPMTSEGNRIATFGNFLEEYSKVSKAKQKALKTTFAESGGIGASFAPHFEHLVQRCTLPAPRDVNAATTLPEYFSDGFYHILPSFFAFIDYLVERQLDFRIVFRTFGKDGANIIDEFNAYCEDRHPFLSPSQRLDGSNPLYPIDLRLSLPQQSGSFTRTSDEEKGLHLSCVNPETNLVTVESGARKVYRTLLKDILRLDLPNSSTQSFPRTYLLRDDFHYWHEHHESDDSGKVMLVEESGGKLFEDFPDDVVQIFFDDNIERNFAHIVDVRDIASFAPIPYSVSKDRYIRRVEPWSIITDDQYYINLLEQHLRDYYDVVIGKP